MTSVMYYRDGQFLPIIRIGEELGFTGLPNGGTIQFLGGT
jgi:hypothetical protein